MGMLALGAEALSPIALLAPGVPLLRLDSVEAAFDGLEVALKGGQMGDDDLFIRAARGGSAGIWARFPRSFCIRPDPNPEPKAELLCLKVHNKTCVPVFLTISCGK